MDVEKQTAFFVPFLNFNHMMLGVGDTRKICFDAIPSTFVMVLMNIDTDTEYL